MGYSYGRTPAGNMGLACDGCGTVGGVRKRACPHRVSDAADRPGGPRRRLAYCPAPALCDACFGAHGGMAGIHGDSCRDGAAYMQAREDREQAALEAGDMVVSAAWGDWADGVPAGMVLVGFRGWAGECKRIIPADAYQPGELRFLSDYPQALEPALA